MFCSVVLQTASASYFGGNHLSTGVRLSFSPFTSFEKVPLPSIWVSRSWGLPRSTLAVSSKTTSLWHFKGNRAISITDVGSFPAVSPADRQTALAYEFARHEHYGHLSTVRAWTFLYDAYASQRLPEHDSCKHMIVYPKR